MATFERSASTVIQVPAETVFDYVTNPHTWPEWLPSSHKLECENRPMGFGDVFHEHWSTRSGPVNLDWVVAIAERPQRWLGLTHAGFMGPVLVEYTIEDAAGGVRFTRTVRNPQRPKPATDDQTARFDAEAELGLANIKRILEARAGA